MPHCDLKHVRVVPMSGAALLRKAALAEADRRHGIPGVADVIRRSPKISRSPPAPTSRHRRAVLAQAVHNRPAGGMQRIAHFLIGRLHLIVL